MLEHIRRLLGIRAARESVHAAIYDDHPEPCRGWILHGNIVCSLALFLAGACLYRHAIGNHTDVMQLLVPISFLAFIIDYLWIHAATSAASLFQQETSSIQEEQNKNKRLHNPEDTPPTPYRRIQRGWNLANMWWLEIGHPADEKDAEAIRRHALAALEREIHNACEDLEYQIHQHYKTQNKRGDVKQTDDSHNGKHRIDDNPASINQSHPAESEPGPASATAQTDPTQTPPDTERQKIQEAAVSYLYSGRALSHRLPSHHMPELMEERSQPDRQHNGQGHGDKQLQKTFHPNVPLSRSRRSWTAFNATRALVLLACGALAYHGALPLSGGLQNQPLKTTIFVIADLEAIATLLMLIVFPSGKGKPAKRYTCSVSLVPHPPAGRQGSAAARPGSARP